MQRTSSVEEGRSRSRGLRRAALLGAVAAVGLLFAGDRAFLQVQSEGGIDPLEALDIQVKSNVLVLLDNSEGMRSPVDAPDLPLGDDDIEGRFYQSKKALSDAIATNADRFSFGLVTWGPDSSVINGSGVTNASTQAQNAPGAYDGPFVYVSFDTTASSYYTQSSCLDAAGAGNAVSRFFCAPEADFGRFSGNASAEWWAGFANSSGENAGTSPRFSDPFPRGCVGSDCRYYMQSRLLRHGVQFGVNLAATSSSDAITGVTSVSCPTPPTGVFAEEDSDRPCFQLNDGTSTTTFWYVSTAFAPDGATSCTDTTTDETASVNTVGWTAECTAAPGAATIAHMTADLGVAIPVDDLVGSGLVADETGTVAASKHAAGATLTVKGVRTGTGSGRPIAAALDVIRTTRSFPQSGDAAVAALQYDFVLLVTSGSDLCADSDADEATRLAAVAAEALYDGGLQRELLIVGFTSDEDTIERLNRIALAGSGGEVQADGSVTCPAGVTCRTAFIANKKDEIDEAIQDALEIAARTGEFATAAVTNGTVYEYGPLIDPDINPMDPAVRYDPRLNITYQSTIEMPGWKGHLYAYINDGTGTRVGDNLNDPAYFDAGQKLYTTTVEPMLDGSTGAKQRYEFADLHAGATSRDIRTSSAALKRRVFTSSPSVGSGGSAYNRSYTRSGDAQFDSALTTGSNVVSVWPPNQSGLTNGLSDIDPAAGTSGPLDVALGLSGLSLEQMQTLGSCQESLEAGNGVAPAACASTVGNEQREMVVKESRQILLAWAAGAEVARSTLDNLPLRDATSGELLYEARDWLLADSTLPQPVLVTPPLSATPKQHVKEWLLYRDGRRDTNLEGIPEASKGFGLRNPDFDNGDPETALDTKPLMSIIYSAHNDGLHAFRAGGNCGDFTGTSANCTETGGEELWNFIPIDQLHKVYYLALNQKVSPHVYIATSSIRVADIFVSGSFTTGGQTYAGRWRSVLYFGRGAAGKFYTAIDVTGAGPFTDEALDTNPPWVLWNRGNEDGRVPEPTTADAGFDGMGETWSTPAIGRSEQFGVEYVAWTGSGYGDSTSEGSTFYVLNAFDGSIIGSSDVGQGTPTYIASNAIVASPSLYNEYYLRPAASLSSVTDRVTRAYVPDVHGRIWRFDGTTGWAVTELGPEQPIADPLALMILNNGTGEQAWIFGGSGNDTRVPESSASPFYMFSFPDTSTSSASSVDFYTDVPLSPGATNVDGFRRPYVDSLGSLYRNASQPAVVFNEAGNGRVFYLARRFDGTFSNCTNKFTSLLFALGAVSGGAAYDFSGDGSADLFSMLTDTRATYLSIQGGGVYVSTSGTTTGVPAPPAPAIGSTAPAAPEPPSLTVTNIRSNTQVCATYF